MKYKIFFEGFANVEADNIEEAVELYKQNKIMYKEEIIRIIKEYSQIIFDKEDTKYLLEDRQWTSKL